MLDRLAKGEADGVLTYHLTRLARNSFDGGRVIYMMDEGTVRQIATPEKTYTNVSDDKFMMQIHFAMAKKSSDDTSQFVRRDVVSKLLRGEYPGMVPVGYLNVNRDGHITKAQDDRAKYLMLLNLGRPLRREEVDPIDGPLVRRLCEEAAKGVLSLPRLRRFSYDLGLRARGSAKMLSKNAVRNLLTNPYLYGVIEYNGTLYDDAYLRAKTGDSRAAIRHEPLISQATFDRVQESLARREKGRYRKHRFAFGGCIVTCGSCGAPVTAERQKGIVYYHCTHNRGSCPQVEWTREDRLTEQLAGILARLGLPQSFLDYSFARLGAIHRRETESAEAQRRKLQGQLNGCQQRLDALLGLKISPNNADGSLLDDAEYLRQKTAIRKELDGVQAQLAALQGRSENWIDDCEEFFRFTQRLARKFRDATPEDNRTLLGLVCSNLTLADHTVAAVYRKPFDAVAEFPLSGMPENTPSERRLVLSEAKKPEIVAMWLGILTAIRTSGLPALILSE